jgi:hypothetical protein
MQTSDFADYFTSQPVSSSSSSKMLLGNRRFHYHRFWLLFSVLIKGLKLPLIETLNCQSLNKITRNNDKYRIKKGSQKGAFHRKNIIGFNPIFSQDYPGITPRPKMIKILI